MSGPFEAPRIIKPPPPVIRAGKGGGLDDTGGLKRSRPSYIHTTVKYISTSAPRRLSALLSRLTRHFFRRNRLCSVAIPTAGACIGWRRVG
eukprot:4478188-Pyramimonas_sp.AAC.3